MIERRVAHWHRDMAEYLERFGAWRKLAPEEELALWEAWMAHRDRAAVRKLLTAHVRIIARVAGKYRKQRGVTAHDVMQEGVCGYIAGLPRWQPGRGSAVSSYCTLWARTYMDTYVFGAWSIVPVAQMRNMVGAMLRNERDEDVVAHTKSIGRRMSLETVQLIRSRMGVSDLSLDMPAGDKGKYTVVDLYTDGKALPDEVACRTQLLAHVDASMSKTCSERERQVICGLFLGERTLQSVGDDLGISRERVRQIAEEALAKLRRDLRRCA